MLERSLDVQNVANASPAVGAKLFSETIAAHGGDPFLNLKTLKMTGRGEFTTPPQTGGLKVPLPAFTYYVAVGGRARLEARSPGGPLLFVIRGKDRGGFLVLAGRTQQLPAELTNDFEPIELLRNAVQQGYPVIASEPDASEVTKEGKPLRRYMIHRGPELVTQAYVESDTKLLRKTVSERSRGEMAVLLSAYRTVSGLEIPGELQLLENGASVIRLLPAEITLDVPIKDTLFEQP